MQPVHNVPKEEWASQTWDSLQAQAATAITPEQINYYVIMVKAMAMKGLPCEECTPHWKALVFDPHSGIDHFTDSNVTLLWWISQVAHNAVNRRLGKPSYPWELVVQRYLTESCTSTCSSSGHGNGASASPAYQSATLQSQVAMLPTRTGRNQKKVIFR